MEDNRGTGREKEHRKGVNENRGTGEGGSGEKLEEDKRWVRRGKRKEDRAGAEKKEG